MFSFCERLVELRLEKNISKKDIAYEIRVSPKQYTRYETGANDPTMRILINIANYYKVSLDYLVGRSDVRDYIDWRNKYENRGNEIWQELLKNMIK